MVGRVWIFSFIDEIVLFSKLVFYTKLIKSNIFCTALCFEKVQYKTHCRINHFNLFRIVSKDFVNDALYLVMSLFTKCKSLIIIFTVNCIASTLTCY